MVAGACDRKGEASSTVRTEAGARKATAGDGAVLAGRTSAAEPILPDPADPEPLAPSEDRPVDEAPPPEVPAPPVAPPDYGVIKPTEPAPDPSLLTLHGLAGYEVVAVHDRPDGESARLGYLRLGTRMFVGERQDGPGCPKGWHALPQGGYACASKGLVVDAKREPPMPNPPPPVRTDTPLPYDYAYVKRWNSPMWWRVPTPQEVTASETIRAEREHQRLVDEARAKGLPPPAAPGKPAPKAAQRGEATTTGSEPASDKPTDGDAAANDDVLSKLPSVDDDAPPKGTPPTGDAPEQAAARPTAPAAKPTAPAAEPAVALAEPAPPINLPLKSENAWLERGFFISVGGKLTEQGRTWWQTARGGFVDTAHAYKHDAKDLEGALLSAEASFPFGYVMVDTTKVFEMQPDGKLKAVGDLERRAFVDLEEEVEIGGKAYMTTTDGHVLRKADLRLADPQPVPGGLQPWERWVDVSLDKQILVAYEGERPVFTTLVSTGKKGTADEPFVTPTGRWRIRSKHISTTMDGNTASDGNYSIQDVPWTMFFEGSYALHGAFWHLGFGRPRSHGCVNLGPSAARWLFYWTTPFLPEGWHGVHAHAGSPGTTVVVRE